MMIDEILSEIPSEMIISHGTNVARTDYSPGNTSLLYN
jgi:hypothetical protein